MGMFGWFKSTSTTHTDVPVEPSGSIEQMQLRGGLDVAAAIAAHRNWKKRLESYIKGTSDEKLDHSVICKDNNCALGKWIYSASSEDFSHIPAFIEVKEIHAKFHIAAGEIVQLADNGEKEKALAQLEHGDYSRHSARVQTKLAGLHKHVN